MHQFLFSKVVKDVCFTIITPWKTAKKSTIPQNTTTFMLYVNFWQHLYIYRPMLPIWLIQFLVHCASVIHWTEKKLAKSSVVMEIPVLPKQQCYYVLWDQNSKTKKGAAILFA